jgi:hypothetical protein
MNQLVNAMQKQANRTTTENGARAYKSTKNAVLDLFASWGGMRGKDITPMFKLAIDEDIHLAVRLALWGRDVRQGAGERELFKQALSHLAYIQSPYVYNIITKVPELGRWDDLFVFFNTKYWEACTNLISNALNTKNGLCAKWMPRKGPIAVSLTKALNLSPKQYRKLLVGLTNVVETQMCDNKWEEIKYEHVPSKAQQIYKNAFKRHDQKGYAKYLQDITNGTKKINAGAVYPYEVIKQLQQGHTELAEGQWKALPDFVPEGLNFLPVIDVSGSMLWEKISGLTTPLDVAVGLGIYLSQRNKSVFKDMFITFSEDPQFQYQRGNLTQRWNDVHKQIISMNTDLNAVFTKLLAIAVKNKVAQEDMPTHIMIISDMQFDGCTNKTNQKQIMQMYDDAGYKAPVLVFWQVNAHTTNNYPATEYRDNVILISGFSPSIIRTILSGNDKDINPTNQMLETLMNKRYDFI